MVGAVALLAVEELELGLYRGVGFVVNGTAHFADFAVHAPGVEKQTHVLRKAGEKRERYKANKKGKKNKKENNHAHPRMFILWLVQTTLI